MNRWVGLGVIADNIVNIDRAMERKAARYPPSPQITDGGTPRHRRPAPKVYRRCQGQCAKCALPSPHRAARFAEIGRWRD
jgi:hypothetical protein